MSTKDCYKTISSSDYTALNNKTGLYRVIESAAVVYKKDNEFHRVGGPAVKRNNGIVLYYQNGLLHRRNGPAYYVPETKYKSYFLFGELHNVNGWAIIEKGKKVYSLAGIKLSEEQYNSERCATLRELTKQIVDDKEMLDFVKRHL